MTIAIVGMACMYPDASSPHELWETVIAQRRAFRRIPDSRLRAEDYIDDDPLMPDRTYIREAALLQDYQFDRERFLISADTYRSTDLTHWLALDVASRALDDANVPWTSAARARTLVLVGNSLTGEMSRAALMRLRWPYARRVTDAALATQGWSADQRRDFLEKLGRSYVAPFAPITEDSLAGALSNTIAGRICNYHDFGAGGYTLDGACSSSLLAVAQACTALEAGDADIALAGGVDVSLDPLELVGFAKTAALARGEMLVYDPGSSGFLPGEGCGFVVLMSAERALALGARTYAFVRGWGISSDGSGGLTRPEVVGQRRAIERAYARAGYDVGTVQLFEGHGTGTPVGDAVELEVLLERSRADPPAVLGSVKANLGHTKAAAGIAGLIKATLALHRQVLPPTTGARHPHPKIAARPGRLRLLETPEVPQANVPLRAGVSAFGFGGINVHVTLESAVTPTRTALSADERQLARSPQDAELLVLSAPSWGELARSAAGYAELAAGLSHAQLADCGAQLAALPMHPYRAAIVARSPKEFAERLLEIARTGPDGPKAPHRGPDVYLGHTQGVPRIGFLFPGQAAPTRLSAGKLGLRFDEIGALYRDTEWPSVSDPAHTALAQPAIVRASVAGLHLLGALGLDADLAIGHSLGELVGMYWAGAMSEETLLRLAALRGGVMGSAPGVGWMASLATDETSTARLIAGTSVVIAASNAPDQTVIAGPAEAIARVIEHAQGEGVRATRLPVSHAFHSAQMLQPSAQFSEALTEVAFSRLTRHLVSTVTGAPLDANADLHELLVRQMTSPVRFAHALGHSPMPDLWIEIGPGAILSELVRAQSSVPVVAMDVPGDSVTGILNAVAAAWVIGAPVRPSALFADRFCRPLALDRVPELFTNPCEVAPPPDPATRANDHGTGVAAALSVRPPSAASSSAPIDVVRSLVAERTGLALSTITPQSRLLIDLHLNSITVASLAGEAARVLGRDRFTAPNRMAGASVAELAGAIAALPMEGTSALRTSDVPGLGAWARAFLIEHESAPRPSARPRVPGRGWTIVAPDGYGFAEVVRAAVTDLGGTGIAVVLPLGYEERGAGVLLEAVQTALRDRDTTHFVLVQPRGGGAAFARTLHLERRDVTCCVLDVPETDEARGWIHEELLGANGYVEALYDAQGQRQVPRLRVLELDSARELPLGPTDVLVVSGGGRGIGAYCALDLARRSGARLVLLGRSPSDDPGVLETLAQLRAAALDGMYLQVDITRADELRAALSRARERYGPITALLHAAGLNVPLATSEMNVEALEATVAPKVIGFDRLTAALAEDPLRVVIGFSSVIARSGMPGDLHYAAANEWLTRRVQRWGALHPDVRCLALEWSIWSGLGMGERLGAVERLATEGVSAITPEAATSLLCALLARERPLPVEAVAAGRLGRNFPTLSFGDDRLPLLRFLERVQANTPGVELVVDSTLDQRNDPYLQDHVLDGTMLVPAVMSLEAMAQSCVALLGRAPTRLEHVEFRRPLIVGSGPTDVRVLALAREDDGVDLAVRAAETEYVADHVLAVARFDVPAAAEPLAISGAHVPGPSASDLYARLLFHGPMFQRIAAFSHVERRGCEAMFRDAVGRSWFGAYRAQELVLGDPGARDAAIHAIQACVPDRRLLPIGVDAVIFYAPQVLRCAMRAQEVSSDGETYTYNIDVLGADGQVVERWMGARFRVVGSTSLVGDWVPECLGPYLERQIEARFGQHVRVAITTASAEAAVPASFAAVTSASVGRRADGAPEASDGFVSASHSGRWTLLCASSVHLGCDLELVTDRSEATWRDLLGPTRFTLAQRLLAETGEDFATAATRVWTAFEAAQKAGAGGDPNIALSAVGADGWITLSAGDLQLASVRVPMANAAVVVTVALTTDRAARV